MKKIIIFASVIILIFGALAFITSYQNKQLTVDNPFGKERLHAETIEQLDDPMYSNIILPEELDEKLTAGEDVTVYFYSPTCQYCNQVSPVLIPLAEDMGVDLKLYNLLEFEQGWHDYGIEGTPVVIHYKNGEQFAEISGVHNETTYGHFYEQVVLSGE
ncbi:thioredoxin family protein [Bacillus shivajii]|uniref:thioredoxin family protein n=1 Tax=Bacillus shivajii TaxID=1983719 RepID=UPI001CFA6323|nr:thioredoxin family protein [Bacillus shivajii]UCZ52061.1 thioredoxin family protein [Bacillus shivajii]